METNETDSLPKVAQQLDQIQAEHKEEVQLSKNQLKKLKKREKWLEIKQVKRRNDKLKRKHRLAEMRKHGEDTGPTRKSLKRKTMTNSTCKIRVVVDLGLDEYMAEKDINSLTCQLQHSYAANRRAANPMQLYFCGISGRTKERLDRIGDYRGWDIHPETRMYEEVFAKESLVYLSSESDNVLTTLSEDKVYVIGGLVDHNKHKGLCHRLAEEKGIAHAQLPITDYLDMKTRKVLTVNQVFSILLRYTELQDWKKAFLAEMPQRKQANAKQESPSESPDVSMAQNVQGTSGIETPKISELPKINECAASSQAISEVLSGVQSSETNHGSSQQSGEVSRTTTSSVSLEGSEKEKCSNADETDRQLEDTQQQEDSYIESSNVLVANDDGSR